MTGLEQSNESICCEKVGFLTSIGGIFDAGARMPYLLPTYAARLNHIQKAAARVSPA